MNCVAKASASSLKHWKDNGLDQGIFNARGKLSFEDEWRCLKCQDGLSSLRNVPKQPSRSLSLAAALPQWVFEMPGGCHVFAGLWLVAAVAETQRLFKRAGPGPKCRPHVSDSEMVHRDTDDIAAYSVNITPGPL